MHEEVNDIAFYFGFWDGAYACQEQTPVTDMSPAGRL
jgi:hypothetical protein